MLQNRETARPDAGSGVSALLYIARREGVSAPGGLHAVRCPAVLLKHHAAQLLADSRAFLIGKAENDHAPVAFIRFPGGGAQVGRWNRLVVEEPRIA